MLEEKNKDSDESNESDDSDNNDDADKNDINAKDSNGYTKLHMARKFKNLIE